MLNVIKPGFFTTIQDNGRFGLLNKGVPVSGQMDSVAAVMVNQLLENERNAALLEITMTGPTLEFEEDTFICFGGAVMSVFLNDIPIDSYKVHRVVKGDIVSYGKLEKGFRNYLGIKNGFKSEVVLGSRSYYFPLTERSHLAKGMKIDYESVSIFEPKITALKIDSVLDHSFLEVSPGPEYDQLTENHQHDLFSKEFKVASENNRMAYQLNDNISGHQLSILTSATMPGTVQLTPSGKILILMKDGQTTGGYPRILQLTNEAIAILSQKKFGDILRFKKTNI